MIFYILIIILILLLFFTNIEYFAGNNNIYEINTEFPPIVDKKKAPYDDPLFYCKDEEYIIDPLDIDFRDISKMYNYRPKRIKSTI